MLSEVDNKKKEKEIMSNEKLTTYTNDLLTFNKHFLSVVRSQKTSDTLKNSKANDLLHNVDIALTNQIDELENFENLIDKSKLEFLKDKTASFFGSIAGSLENLRKEPISKMLRDDYTALSMLASGYTMLYTAALVNGMKDLADFAKNSLDRVAQLITETSRVIPLMVAIELTGNSENANKIGEKALEETQKSWNYKEMLEEA